MMDWQGVIAQLGERLNGIQEVGGSIPPGSTKSSQEKLRPMAASGNDRHFRDVRAFSLLGLEWSASACRTHTMRFPLRAIARDEPLM